MRRSLGSILISTSSASGSTATVTAEVCTRPCCSVAGTRCTRCTPLSYLSCENTRLPSMIAITSFNPPADDSDDDSTSTFHRCVSAYLVYIRKISAANRVASSPPVPARISRIMFFSSFGSLGSSRTFSSSSTPFTRASSWLSSSCAYARISASFSSDSNALLSAIPLVRSLYSRYFSTIGAISACALAVFWYFAESLTISGDASALVSSSYRTSIWSKRSNMENRHWWLVVRRWRTGSFRYGDSLSLYDSISLDRQRGSVRGGAATQSPVRRRAPFQEPLPRRAR